MEENKKKKILKIIQFIYNVISGLFIVFVVGSLILGACHLRSNNDSQIIDVVEKKQRAELFTYNGYHLVGIDEVFSDTEFYNFAFLPQEHFEDYSTIGGTLTTTRLNVGTGLVNWSYSGISRSDLGYSNATALSNIQFTLNQTGVNNNVRYQDWSVKINCASSYYLTFNLSTLYNSVSGVSYGQTMLYTFISNVNFNHMPNSQASVFITPSSTDFGVWITGHIGNGITENESYIVGYNNGYQDGYNTGFNAGTNNNGYNDGYDEGYEIGHSDGYDEGVENGLSQGLDTGYSQGYQAGYSQGENDYSQGNPYSVFTLISSAFQSVASIFNIAIIPGLTIGVLVFTPVIIFLVIVVFKMFKG